MIWRMMRHEWRVLHREKTIWLVVAALALSAGYAFWHGSQLVDQHAASIESFDLEQEHFLSDAKQKAESMEHRVADGLNVESLPENERAEFKFGPRQSSWIGTRVAFAVLHPTSLAPLAIGQTDVYAPAVIVSSANYGGGVAGISTENPLKLLAGHFDLARVVIHLLPLFILGLSFNLLSGERESGTLRLFLAHPVRLRDLLIAKIAVRALVVFSATILFFVAGMTLIGIGRGTEDALPKLLLWLIAVILYSVFWFALAVLVNGFGHNSGTSALILVVGWLVFVVVVPAFVNFAAASAYPLPPPSDFIGASRQTREEVSKLPEAEVRKSFFAEHPEFLLAEQYSGDGDYYVTSSARLDEADRRLQPLKQGFRRQFLRRQTAEIVGGFFSPTILTQAALFKIAGTEPNRYQNFQLQAEQLKQARYAFFRPKMFQIKKFADANFAPADYDHIPQFEFREESLGDLLSDSAVLIGGLLLQLLLTGFLIRRIYGRGPWLD